MKRCISHLFLMAMAFLAFAGCKKDDESKALSVVGDWELMSIETKGAKIGDTPVSVTISFLEDGTFTMSQLVGEGRSSSYSGTYVFADGLLSGTYSSGKPWGDTYTVVLSDDTMALTSSDGKETDTYKKKL